MITTKAITQLLADGVTRRAICQRYGIDPKSFSWYMARGKLPEKPRVQEKTKASPPKPRNVAVLARVKFRTVEPLPQ